MNAIKLTVDHELAETGPKHYDLSRYVDLALEKVEIAATEAEFEVNPGLALQVTINNNSDHMVEIDRIHYPVFFKLPHRETTEESFILIGKGYAIMKNLLGPREKQRLRLLLELFHSKVTAISRVLKVAKTVEGAIEVYAYFNRYPTVHVALPLIAPETIRAWKEQADFPPMGGLWKRLEFKIPLDEWEAFVERVRLSIS